MPKERRAQHASTPPSFDSSHIAYERTGSAPTALAFVHGGLGTSRLWDVAAIVLVDTLKNVEQMLPTEQVDEIEAPHASTPRSERRSTRSDCSHARRAHPTTLVSCSRPSCRRVRASVTVETTEKPAFPEAPPDEATAEVEARLRDALSLPLDDPRRQRLVCASRMLVQDDKKRRRRTRTTIRRAGQGATRLLQQEAAKLAAEVAHVEHDLQKPAGESLRTALALLLLIGLVAAVLARFLEKLGVF